MKDKPAFCYSSGCPLADKGRGFVLGVGDPVKSKLIIILEAPGKDELEFTISPQKDRRILETKEQCEEEIARRLAAYPEIEPKLLRKGVPVVGRSGAQLSQWALPNASIKREEVFIDNVLRCLPPKLKDKQYPIGEDKAKAELCCRHYDRVQKGKVDILLSTIHPAAIMREVTPLPLQIEDLKKAKSFSTQGYRTAILMGGKATDLFMRFGANVAKWRGSYIFTGKKWYEEVINSLVTKSERKGKAKKSLSKAKQLALSTETKDATDLLFETSISSKLVSRRKPRKKKEDVNAV